LPVNWPIGIGEEFRGVIDRFTREVILFDKAVRGKQSNEKRMSLDDKELSKYVERDLLDISLSSKLILFSFDCFPLTALSNKITSLVNLSMTPLNSSPIPIGQLTGKE
jgi:peptide subunit release factor RF-3